MENRIGNKIKKLRELRNYSQSHVAQELGISQKAYSNIEADITSVTYKRLEEIAKVLEVSVEKVLGFDEKNIFNNDNQQGGNSGIINIFHQMENEKQLYEKLLLAKDEIIEAKQKLIDSLSKK